MQIYTFIAHTYFLRGKKFFLTHKGNGKVGFDAGLVRLILFQLSHVFLRLLSKDLIYDHVTSLILILLSSRY